MHKLIRALFTAAIVLCLNNYRPVIALQSSPSIELLKPIAGVLSDAQTEQRWTFTASKGQRIAVRMQATSGDLDPYIELLGKDNTMLVKGATTSLRNATIDGFTIPETGTYTLRATRSEAGAKTSGAYSLSLLPGFSFLVLNDPNGTNAPMRTWQLPNSFSHFANNSLEMQLMADNSYTWTNVVDRFGMFKDLYLQADFTPLPTSKYWEAGLMLRGARLNDTIQFYVFFINSEGKYKLALSQPGGLKDIQDWKALPVSIQPNPSLGLMVKDTTFTLFYNSQPIAELKDDKLKEAGSFGVAIGTGAAPNNNTTVRFKNFIVTLPADEAASGPIPIPEKLADWQRVQETLLVELVKLRLVPGVGKVSLEIKDKPAFVTNNTGGGIVMKPLAESLNFSDLVYSADVTWESNNDNTACAMELRAADDSNFTIVYFDRKGGYGIRQVIKKKGDKTETVPVAIYNLSDTIIKENKATNRVTIIAVGNSLIVYMNGTLLANLNVKQTTGGVRIATYNYQRASSLCQFTNLWLRSFDQ